MSDAKVKFPHRLRAVLFDLDGTLVDTADEFVPAVQALRAEHDLAPMDPDRIRASVSNGARALVALGLDIHESDSRFETQRLRLLAVPIRRFQRGPSHREHSQFQRDDIGQDLRPS